MSVNLINVFSHIIHNEQEQIKMNDEMKKVINKALQEEFNNGYLQGVWDFLKELKNTHKLPQEIADELLHGKKGSIQA